MYSCIPLKDKTGKEIINAFKDLFKNRKPKKLRTDKGKEFVMKNVKCFLRVMNFIGSHLKVIQKLKFLNGLIEQSKRNYRNVLLITTQNVG